MEERKIVMVVEEAEAARTALKWALRNILRYGDVLTLLHLLPYNSPNPKSKSNSKSKSRSKKKLRILRLHGYQLALSFQDICSASSFNTKVDIVVTEDDPEGERIVSLVKEIDAFALVLGLHDHSFIYRLGMRHGDITQLFNCKVLAIKQPKPSPSQALKTTTSSLLSASSSSSPLTVTPTHEFSPNLDFSQIEIAPLQFPEIVPAKIPYQICPSPHAIIWRSKKTRRRQRPI